MLPIKGYAYRTGAICSEGDSFKTSAFQFNKNHLPAMLWQHERNEIVGRWTKIKKKKKGLWVEGILLRTDLIELVNNDVIFGLSIGFSRLESVVERGNGWQTNYATRTYLPEISLVSIPAYDKCYLEKSKRGKKK